MRFAALQADFDEWLSSMQLSSHWSEAHEMLPLFKVEPSAYSIPIIELWEEVEPDEVFHAILDLPLLPHHQEDTTCLFIHSVAKCTVEMPKFCTDVQFGLVNLEQETPIECDKLFEFFQPPPIEEALHIGDYEESNPPLYLQNLNMVFAVLQDTKFEVEPQSEPGLRLESCTVDEEPLLPTGLIETLLLEHYTPNDPNSYISAIVRGLEIDQRWCIAKDISLPCNQVVCDENLDNLCNLGLEEHFFIESPSRDIFEEFPTVGIDIGPLEFFSSFEERVNFEEARVPGEAVPCPGRELATELTFRIAHSTAQIKCEIEQDVCLENCTVIVNYGALMEYKVMSELSKNKARVVEREFGPPETRLLLLSSDHAIVLSDLDNCKTDSVRSILARSAFVWVAVMIGDKQDLSKTMIRHANSIAAMSANRCKLLVLQDAKDLCHLIRKIRALEKIDSTAEDALSAHERFLCRLDGRMNHFRVQSILAKAQSIRDIFSDSNPKAHIKAEDKEEDIEVDLVDLTREGQPEHGTKKEASLY